MLALVPPGGRAASYELVSVETRGYGESEQAAIVDALVEAVRQAHGVSVDAERTLRTSLAEANFSQRLSVEFGESIQTRTRGLVHSYEVLDVSREDQRWIARLLVTLPQYRAPGPDRSHLRTMAVLPFRAGRESLVSLAPRWEQKLVAHLVQSRRFRVLDREYTRELDEELTRIRSRNMPVTELVRIGQGLGADYVVLGELTEFELRRSTTEDEVLDASLIVDYRVMEPATEEVRWAGTVNMYCDRRQLEEYGLQFLPRQLTDHLLDEAADEIVTEILDLIYPVKVVQVNADGGVVLTQGGNRVRVGDLRTVHASGEAIDPDTGLKIRPDGPEVALIKVIRVDGKSSLAIVEKQNAGTIGAGMVCRRLSKERLTAMQPPPPALPDPLRTSYGSAGQKVVSEQLLGVEEPVFLRFFSVQCTEVSFEQPGTVHAAFRLAQNGVESGAAAWTRIFQVAQRFSVREYRGLSDPRTVNGVAQGLKEQIALDGQAMNLLRTTVR